MSNGNYNMNPGGKEKDTEGTFNQKQTDTISKLRGKENPISWAEAHGREEVHFNEAGEMVKGPRPGKFEPITIGPFTIQTKGTQKLGYLKTSKGNKSKTKELNEFNQSSLSREQASEKFPENDPSNVSTLRLSYKDKWKSDKKGAASFSTTFTKSKSKFKAVENNELLKHVEKNVSRSAGFRLGNIGSSASVGRSSSREEVRSISPNAARRKGDRWQRRQERKNKKK